MRNKSYIIYDTEWPESPDAFMAVILAIAERLNIDTFKICYLEIYKKPIKYHVDQVLSKEELRNLLTQIWQDNYWAYIVGHNLSFCMYEDNIHINCRLSIDELSGIAKQFGLRTKINKITDNKIEKYCYYQSLITSKQARIKGINKPPIEGYDATPVLLPPKAVKEYELDKSPFGNINGEWSCYQDIGEIFNGIELTEEIYLETVNKMVDCIKKITDFLELESFKTVQYKSFDNANPPMLSKKRISQNEMLEILRFGLVHGDEFVIKSKNFVLYSKLDFRLGINTVLHYDEMRQIADEYGLFSTVMWKEWKKRRLFG